MQHLTNKYWDELIEKYFDGLTTREEEDLLIRFLATPQGGQSRYDEIRAVMSYHVMAKRKKVVRKPSTKIVRQRMVIWRNIAASLLFVVGCTFAFHFLKDNSSHGDLCMARVNGKVVTDEEVVLQLMHQTLQSVDLEKDVNEGVEAQMNEMFNIVNP